MVSSIPLSCSEAYWPQQLASDGNPSTASADAGPAADTSPPISNRENNKRAVDMECSVEGLVRVWCIGFITSPLLCCAPVTPARCPRRAGSRVGGHEHVRCQRDRLSDPLPQTAGVHAERRESLRWNASSRRELQRSVEAFYSVLASPRPRARGPDRDTGWCATRSSPLPVEVADSGGGERPGRHRPSLRRKA